jgi:hypothetical protein
VLSETVAEPAGGLALPLPHGEVERLAGPALVLCAEESDNAGKGLADAAPVEHAVAPPLSDEEALTVACSGEGVGEE